MKFERVSKYPEAVLPVRKTAKSAGYDFTVAEDIIIPSCQKLLDKFPKNQINPFIPMTNHIWSRNKNGINKFKKSLDFHSFYLGGNKHKRISIPFVRAKSIIESIMFYNVC